MGGIEGGASASEQERVRIEGSAASDGSLAGAPPPPDP